MEDISKEGMIKDIHLANNYGPEFLVIEKGKGSWIVDIEGKKYLDFTAGIAVNALGYGREDLAITAYEQMLKVIHTSNLYTTEPVIKLAERLVKTGSFTAVHFSNSGSEANETALKYARLYSLRRKGREHSKILAFSNAFHGRTLGALSCTPNSKYQDPFKPLIPGVEICEYNNTEMLSEILNESFAAVIVEVIQGEGGLNVMTKEFADALNSLCRRYDIILIADEVQTGLSRSGTFYASQGVGLKPDIITLAKPLAGGLPLSATLIPERINTLIHVGEHGSTFGGGPVTAAVALKVLDVLSEEEFIAEVSEKGEYFGELLAELGGKHPSLGTVKGRGLLRGIEYLGVGSGDNGSDKDFHTGDPSRVISLARKRGLLILRSGTNVLRFAPPLVISKAELKEGVDILDRVIGELEKN